MVARPLQRLLLGSAHDVDMDGSGRILVSPELRNAASMTREVMLLGMGGHFELWDAAQWARREAEDLATGLPEALDLFSFCHRPWSLCTDAYCWSLRSMPCSTRVLARGRPERTPGRATTIPTSPLRLR